MALRRPLRETSFSDDGEKTPVMRSLVANVSSVPGGVSNTIFATEPLTLNNDTMDYTTWILMNEALRNSRAMEISRDGELVEFSCYTPHCIQPATRDGVRMVTRISLWKRPRGFQPGLTSTEQVYRVAPPWRG